MQLELPIVFRFKILPYLKDRILPKYTETLQTQGNYIMSLSEDDCEILAKYALFISCIYNKNIELKRDMDINEMHPFFEIIEKHVNIFMKTMRQTVLDEEEKNKIISQFDMNMKPYVIHILS